jgi:hypothetical protein
MNGASGVAARIRSTISGVSNSALVNYHRVQHDDRLLEVYSLQDVQVKFLKLWHGQHKGIESSSGSPPTVIP